MKTSLTRDTTEGMQEQQNTKRQTSETQTQQKFVHYVPIFADSPPSSVEVKKGWSYTSTLPPHVPSRNNFTSKPYIYLQDKL
jgi:hypothetical protein